MIELKDVCVSFRKENQQRIFGKERQQVLFDVSMKVQEGTCMGILGESGSGKSTMGRIICGLLKPDSGSVYVEKPISVVFQDYTTSANPRFTVRQIITESFVVRKRRDGIALDQEAEIEKLLKEVGLETEHMERYPHELSGGQLQRVCIARAIAVKPNVILFDEAISSLDAHTQVQIMELLKKLKQQYGLTYIFITHDLTSVTYFCDQVLFLYQGKVVEVCEVPKLAYVKHSYARKLLNSIVDIASA